MEITWLFPPTQRSFHQRELKKGATNAGGCRSSLYIMALDNAVATVEFLLNHGANTELQDCDGRTALHVAAWQGYTDIVQVKIFMMV